MKDRASLWSAQGQLSLAPLAPMESTQERAFSSRAKRNIFLVVMAAGIHPFPFRTRKLSLPAPMVLGGRPPGRVGRRQNFFNKGLVVPTNQLLV